MDFELVPFENFIPGLAINYFESRMFSSPKNKHRTNKPKIFWHYKHFSKNIFENKNDFVYIKKLSLQRTRLIYM